MNYYPQYIHVPTTVPVQRYFADSHVPINRYDAGDFINKVGSGVNTLGGKINGVLGKTGTLGNVFGGNKLSPSAGGIVSGIGSAIGQGAFKLGTGNFDRGTGVGNAVNGVGNFVGGLVGKVNPLLGGIVKAGAGIIGGLANRIGGYHLNEATIGAINSDISSMNNTRVTDSSNQSIANQAMAQNWGGSFNLRDIGSWGWASKGKVQNQYNKLQRGMASGQNYMAANYANAADNVTSNTMNNLLINSSAGGGILDRSFGNTWNYDSGSRAIAYGMDQAALANQQQMLNQMQPQNFGIPMQPQQYGCGGCKPHCFGGRLFAEGGSMNTHGSDFTNGLMYITEGGRHEENPYQGVPMGYDQHGTPNVVEEGEIIIPGRMLADGGEMSDYVVSNRTTISEELADKYQLPYDTTHAEALEILTEESQENPTDIIAQNTDKAIAREIYADQEKVKQQEQQRQAMMQQMMQQQAAPEQMMMAPQDQMEGPAMDELMAQQAQQEGIPMQPQMSASGGSLFGYGGPVNMFLGLPGASSYIVNRPSGNQLSPAYTYQDAYNALMAPEILKWAKEHITQGQSESERAEALKILNSLQETWYRSGIGNLDLEKESMASSPYLRDLERIAQDDMGINARFTDEAFKEYFRNHAGLGDNFPNYKDSGKSGGENLLRNAGIAGNLNRELAEYLRSVGVEPRRGEFGANVYDFDNALDWVPGEEYSHTKYEAPVPDIPDDVLNSPMQYNDVETALQAAKDAVTSRGDGEEDEEYKPLPTWMRQVPLWMSGLGVLTDALGITNRPDYSAADRYEALANSNNGFMPVSYHPNGEQMVYKPYDPVLQNIMNQADVAATRRGIIDNNGPATNAALLALNRNAMKANGELGLAARQYNDQLLNNTLQFNNAVNAQNSQGILSADAQNAANWARQRSMFGYMMGDAIAARQAAEDKADAARALNLSNFAKGMHNLGLENTRLNSENSAPQNGGYWESPDGTIHYLKKKKQQPATAPAQPSLAFNLMGPQKGTTTPFGLQLNVSSSLNTPFQMPYYLYRQLNG